MFPDLPTNLYVQVRLPLFRQSLILAEISRYPLNSQSADILADWEWLSARHCNSTAYAHHDGRAVLSLWGFGFTDRPDPGPRAVADLVGRLRGSAYLVGGCPTYWAEGGRDSLTRCVHDNASAPAPARLSDSCTLLQDLFSC
jgi:hypothetical protein